MDQNNNGFNNQNNNDYTEQYNQYNQPQQYGEPQPQQYEQPQPYQQYAQPQQPQYDQQYGQLQQPQQYQQYDQPQQYNDPYFNQQYPTYAEINNGKKGMGIASMVLGIVSVVLCCLWYIAPITAVVGLILGIISLKKEDAGKGMAIAGIILSSIGILLGIYMIFCAILAFSRPDFYDLFVGLY